jgi:hypothetical protein
MEQFPWMSPFVGYDNNPILYIDPYGLESTTDGEDDKKKEDTKPTKKIVRPSDRKKQEEPRENDGLDGKAQEFIPEGAPENPCDGDKAPSTNSQINYFEYDGEMNHWEGILNEAIIHTKKSNNAYQGLSADYTFGQNWGQVSGRKISYNQNALVQQYTNFGNAVIGGSFGVIGAVPAISYGILTAPVWAPFVWNVATKPFIAATGKYGTAAQLTSYYQLGATAADAVSQITNISVNGGKWNYGSTIGNLYIPNPWLAPAPGLLYSTATDRKNMGMHLKNYGLNVLGNGASGIIKNSNILLPGMTHGLGAFTIPLIINTGGTQIK